MADMPLPTTPPHQREAYFSTKGGQFPPRFTSDINPRPIAFGDIFDKNAHDQLIQELREAYPEKCMKISFTEPQDLWLLDYFDNFDISTYGEVYLLNVLTQMANDNVARDEGLDKFAQTFRQQKGFQFWSVGPLSRPQEVFDKALLDSKSHYWLRDAVQRICLLQKSLGLGSFVQDFSAHNEPQFWNVRHHTTPQELFDAAISNAQTKEWLEEAIQRIVSLQNELSPQATHAQAPNRGNFHTDPERGIQEQISEDAARHLQYSVPRTVVSHNDEGNALAQRHRLASHEAGIVPFEDRMAFPPPLLLQAQPRRNPTQRAFSNDARVLEKREAQGNQRILSTNLPPIPESSSPLPTQQSFTSHGPTATGRAMDPRFAGERPSMMHTAGIPSSHAGYPLQSDYNVTSPLQTRPLIHGQSVVDAQYRSTSLPMPIPGHSQMQGGPPVGYYLPHLPGDQPSRSSRQQQPPMSQGPLNGGNMRRASGGNRNEFVGQENIARNVQGPAAASGGRKNAPKGSRNGSVSSESQDRRLQGPSDKPVDYERLWIGSLLPTDTAEMLLPVFSPFGVIQIENPRGNNPKSKFQKEQHFTYARFPNWESASAALFVSNKPLAALGSRQIFVKYAHRRAPPPGHVGQGSVIQQQPPSLAPQQNAYVSTTMPGPTAINDRFNGQAGSYGSHFAGTDFYGAPHALDPRGPNRGSFTENTHSGRPQLNVDTNLQTQGSRPRSQVRPPSHQSAQTDPQTVSLLHLIKQSHDVEPAKNAESLPTNRDTIPDIKTDVDSLTAPPPESDPNPDRTRILSTGNRASSGGLLSADHNLGQVHDAESSLSAPPDLPSEQTNINNIDQEAPTLDDQPGIDAKTISFFKSIIDRQADPEVPAGVQDTTDNTAKSTTATDHSHQQAHQQAHPESGTAVSDQEGTASVKHPQDSIVRHSTDQITTSTTMGAFPLGNQVAVVDKPAEPARAASEDVKAGPGKSQPQAGAPGQGKRNKKKGSFNNRKGPKDSQPKKSKERDDSVGANTVSGKTEDGNLQGELPRPGDAVQVDKQSNESPMDKAKANEQNVQTDGAAKPIDPIPVDRPEQTNEVPIAKKTDGGDGVSSPEAVETPAGPYETQPTTYAPSETDESSNKVVQNPTMQEAAQALIAFSQNGVGQGESAHKGQTHRTAGKGTSGREADQNGAPRASRPPQQPFQTGMIIPAVPNRDRMKAQYHKDRQIRISQEQREEEQAAVDASIEDIRQPAPVEDVPTSPAKSLGTDSTVTIGRPEQQFDDISTPEDSAKSAHVKQSGTPLGAASIGPTTPVVETPTKLGTEASRLEQPAAKVSAAPKVSSETVSTASTRGPITTRMKKQKNRPTDLSNPQSATPESEPTPSVNTHTTAEAAPEAAPIGMNGPQEASPKVDSLPDATQQVAEQDTETASRDQAVEQGDTAVLEEQHGSGPGSEPDQPQPELVSGQGASAKKKKNKKKSKKKKGTTPNAAVDGKTPSQRNLPPPERPFEIDDAESDENVSSGQQDKSKIMESHREQTDPNAEFFAARDAYYRDKDAMYHSVMPYRPEPRKEPSVEDTVPTYTPMSPESHRREMLKQMMGSGYIILEDAEKVEYDSAEAKGGKIVTTMSEHQLESLKKLVHVGKTAVSKEKGSQRRKVILDQLPSAVVEGYINGSLGWKSAAYKALGKEHKDSLKELYDVDTEEAKHNAKLKANEDDAPPPRASQPETSRRRKPKLPGFEKFISSVGDKMAEQLSLDKDVRKNFSDQAAQVNRKAKDQFDLGETFAGFARDDMGRSIKPGQAAMQQGSVQPTADQLAKITHGDGTVELVSIPNNLQDEAISQPEHIQQPSFDADLAPNSERGRTALDARAKGKSKKRARSQQDTTSTGSWSDRIMNGISLKMPPPTVDPPSPLKSTDIVWQWPGQPTPNIIVDCVIYVRKNLTSNIYEHTFPTRPTDKLIINTKENCIEHIERGEDVVWYRKDIPDPAARDPSPTTMEVRHVMKLQETNHDEEEIVWDKVPAGKGHVFTGPKTVKKGSLVPFVAKGEPAWGGGDDDLVAKSELLTQSTQ